MNIEKTLQLIAESQLRAERRADKADQRADKADQRADRADQRADRADLRMDRFEKKLNATADLVRAGIKMVRGIQKSQIEMKAEIRELRKEVDYKFNSLMDSQLRTDEKFNRLLELLRRKNTNGHNRPN